jgi:DNA mismatch endonuclease, patch repair protein
MDVFTKEKRSEVMSRIRGRDTKPEYFIRSGIHRLGYRFRLHVPDLPGKPDLVLPKYTAIIFVHGCFWHGHECHLFKWPKSRVDFWRKKILKNRENDEKVLNTLKISDWRVLVIWECALKGKERIDPKRVIEEVAGWLESGEDYHEIKGRTNGTV